jgi:trans-aconitate methyltransferase
MKRSPIEVFNEWATLDKDFGMEQNHKRSVENMLTFALKQNNSFSFIDAGCGNGWVVKKVGENQLCNYAVGVDGSDKMIEKAKTLDPSGSYVCADLMSWCPEKPVDIVHSMEVFYYLENPKELIKQIFDSWLNNKGRLIIGLDFYFENKVSHDWSESCGISNMKLFSENEWLDFFKVVGFQSINSWRFGEKDSWGGTLIITGLK